MKALERVSQEEAQRRLEICKGNEEYYPCDYYFKATGNCKRCGCFVKLKTKFKTQSCPINKW
jgi:hypothetical protein